MEPRTSVRDFVWRRRASSLAFCSSSKSLTCPLRSSRLLTA